MTNKGVNNNNFSYWSDRGTHIVTQRHVLGPADPPWGNEFIKL